MNINSKINYIFEKLEVLGFVPINEIEISHTCSRRKNERNFNGELQGQAPNNSERQQRDKQRDRQQRINAGDGFVAQGRGCGQNPIENVAQGIVHRQRIFRALDYRSK